MHPSAEHARDAGQVAWVVAFAALAIALLALVWWIGRAAPPTDVAGDAYGSDAADARQGTATQTAARSGDRSEPRDASLPHTGLPLRLVATVVRENPALSLATVEDTARTTHQVMSEGQHFDRHPRARLVRIERGRVILDDDGVREQLVLDRSDRAPLAESVPIAREEQERRRAMADRLRVLRDRGADAFDRGERTGLLAEGAVSPVYEGDELVGVRVDEIRAGGVYDRFGIRDGDVITAINGVSLGEPTAAADVLTDLAFADVLEVEIEREGGAPELLSVPTDELTALLAEVE